MNEFISKKSLLVSKSPNFPACFLISDENEPAESIKNYPEYDADSTKLIMERTFKLANQKNCNSEDEDWEAKILKYGWTIKQTKLFNKVVEILDQDHLSRLTNVESRRHEVVQARIIIDKSADRMRHALASIAWDTGLIQWLHALLMEFLPPSYLAAYLDIMQTMKNKTPSLVDKMIFWKPGNVSQDLLAQILKKPWQPALTNKYRKLPGSALIVVITPFPRISPQPSRVQRLYSLFATMAPILPVQMTIDHSTAHYQSLQSISEQTVSITRTKIQELKAENPDRRLILVGMYASSALALQVALVEQVSGVVCFGFSYHTVHGTRGHTDDQIQNLNTPILFMIGQNAARSSEEEIEQFREKLTAPSTVLTVGGADDFLRVCKKKRRFEGVTQEMIDNMIVDEIAEFATKCIQRPLPAKAKIFGSTPIQRQIDSSTGQYRKRKSSQEKDSSKVSKPKPPKIMRPTSTSNDAIEMAVQSILPDAEDKQQAIIKPTPQRIVTNSNQRLKMMPQFTTIKSQSPSITSQKFITIDSKHPGQKSIISITPRPSSRPSTPLAQQITLGANSRITVGKLPVQQPQLQNSFSPPKFTILRTGAAAEGDLSSANIFDMPIVFADSEGNINDDASEGSVVSISSESSSPVSGNKVILKTANLTSFVSTPPTVTITKNKNILIQKPSTSKMLVLNGPLIGRPVSASNVIIPKATSQQTTLKVQKFMTPVCTAKETKPIPSGKKIEILNNTLIKPASILPNNNNAKRLTFVNLTDVKPMTTTRLSLPALSQGTVKTGQQIVLKTANLKPFTVSNKQFNNLTVKRLNIPSTSSNIPATTSSLLTSSASPKPEQKHA